jgi:hypothetical protein
MPYVVAAGMNLRQTGVRWDEWGGGRERGSVNYKVISLICKWVIWDRKMRTAQAGSKKSSLTS